MNYHCIAVLSPLTIRLQIYSVCCFFYNLFQHGLFGNKILCQLLLLFKVKEYLWKCILVTLTRSKIFCQLLLLIKVMEHLLLYMWMTLAHIFDYFINTLSKWSCKWPQYLY